VKVWRSSSSEVAARSEKECDVEERRGHRSATGPKGYLDLLPASQLLERLPTSILGIGLLGDIAYANPACAELFGYVDGSTVTRLYLPDLMTGHEASEPADCLDTLRTTTSAVDWNHSQGYRIRTMVTPPLLLRATDALLLIGITDVTDWLWETNRRAGPTWRNVETAR
jgi:PAS domain-containing protein